jgi:hypothetical protein
MKKSLLIIILLLGCTIKYNLILAQEYSKKEQEVLDVATFTMEPYGCEESPLGPFPKK